MNISLGSKKQSAAVKKIFSSAKPPLSGKQVKQVKKIIMKEGETKHHTLVTGLTTVDIATPHQALMTIIDQGQLDTNRNGDKLTLKSINVRMRALILDTTADSPYYCTFRVMIVQDKSYNAGGSLTLSQLLSASTTLSQRNVDYLKTLVVLYDKLINLERQGPMSRSFSFKPNLKFLKRDIQYVAAGATAQTGGIYIVVINDTNSATDPRIEYTTRVTFSDK